MTKEQAIKIAEEYLANEVQKRFEPKLKLVLSATIEEDDFFAFHYNSAKSMETGDILDTIVDNRPFIIRRIDGKIFEISVYYHSDEYIEHFKKYGEIKPDPEE